MHLASGDLMHLVTIITPYGFKKKILEKSYRHKSMIWLHGKMFSPEENPSVFYSILILNQRCYTSVVFGLSKSFKNKTVQLIFLV